MEPMKSDVLHFRVRPELKRALDLVAFHEGRNLSEMARVILREGIEKRGYDSSYEK
jgi:hypothetical protein